MHQNFYTCSGLQRYTAVRHNTVSYELNNAPEGTVVEFSAVEVPNFVTASAAQREVFHNSFIPLTETSGIISGATALRVRIGQNMQGHVGFFIEGHDGKPDFAAIGELTRINGTLARINADMRDCARLAA